MDTCGKKRIAGRVANNIKHDEINLQQKQITYTGIDIPWPWRFPLR